jgi:GntR family transcriptional regulator
LALEDILKIIISSNTNIPIYEQITSQIKNMIMSDELSPGDAIPSMRALAKILHISVITVQKAYEDLQRDGFIVTTVGKGSFVAVLDKHFILEEQQRKIEAHLEKATTLARSHGIHLEKLIEIMTFFYEEEA